MGAGAAGALGVLVSLVQDPAHRGLSEPLMITLLVCITAILISYNVSRGMAKYEYRGVPPTDDVPRPPA